MATTFPLIPRRRVAGLPFGGVRSVHRGAGSDIASSREYRPGDNVSAIDWGASARLSAARGTDEFVVRERFADESPRVVVLVDRRPSMSIPATELRQLDKPAALLTTLELIGASARMARSLTGYLDYADGEPHWRPPRSERSAAPQELERPFGAVGDTVSLGLEFLARHRGDLPTQSFVFVVSDFLEPPVVPVWRSVIEHDWELVPVVIQDPAWERTFPLVGGVTVPYADPRNGRVSRVYLTRKEARRLRDEHEARWEARVRCFRNLDADPVVVHGDDEGSVLAAFLRWADLRRFVRGVVA